MDLESLWHRHLESSAAPSHAAFRRCDESLRLLHGGSQHPTQGFPACTSRGSFGGAVERACFDPKSTALIALTKEIVTERGHVSAQLVDDFLAAGYQKDQVLDVLIGIALKTMSNYVDHISPTELDRAFQAER